MTKRDRSKGIYDRRSQNEMKTCSYPSCGKPRRGLSKFCVTHEGKQQRYGHPAASFVHPRLYACDAEEVKTFVAKHIEHKGIQAAIS